MKFIDLTAPLNQNTPVYPGDPTTVIKPAGILNKHGYQDHFVSVGTHVGTHIDAPAHMIKNGKTLDQIDIEKFIGRGVYIQVGKEITLDKINSTDIKENDIVLLHTGMDEFYHEKEYFENYPYIPEAVANYLVKKKIKMLGVDMCSPDHEPFPVHKIFLSSEILIIENLTNLSMLKDKKIEIYALPIKLQLDGAQARVIARILE